MRQSNRGVLGAIAGVVAATAAVVAAAAKAVIAAIGVAAIQPKTGCTLKIRYYISFVHPPYTQSSRLARLPQDASASAAELPIAVQPAWRVVDSVRLEDVLRARAHLPLRRLATQRLELLCAE